MTDADGPATPLNADLALQVFEFGASNDGRVEIVSDERRGWLALEETQSTFAFAEIEGEELRILPFLGDVEAARVLPFVRSVEESWLEGAHEIVVGGAGASDPEATEVIAQYLEEALQHWHRSVTSTGLSPVQPRDPNEVFDAPEAGNLDVEIVCRTSKLSSRNP